MRLCFSFFVLKLKGDIERALVEVGSRFVISVARKLLRHLLVHHETLTALLVSPVQFSLH